MGFALYKEGMQEPVQQLGCLGEKASLLSGEWRIKTKAIIAAELTLKSAPSSGPSLSEPLELVIKGRAERGV